MSRTLFSLSVMACCCIWPVPADSRADEQGTSSDYLDEPIYDTTAHSDEALVNVRLAVSGWPDCTTLESAIRDIFRIEGVTAKSDQEKALALWKWFRILVSATGGGYAFEGPKGRETLCHDPHKIFTVYGHHMCDGQSWAMVGLWRGAGYMALDECTHGHTTAALRYCDADSQYRYHSFDPQRRYYHWDEANQRVATRSLPVMRGMVYRHLTAPRRLHSLRTSLRIGETIERRWDNSGHVMPSGKDKTDARQHRYYAYTPGKQTGIYAVVGEEIQTFEPPKTPDTFAAALHNASRNVACSPPAADKATVHPEQRGRLAAAVYRLAPPYVITDGHCEVTFVKSVPSDVCRLLISRDGNQWETVFEKETVGQERKTIDFGWEAWTANRPNAYGGYACYVKAEFETNGDIRGVGFRDLKIVVHRMLNKRTLPNMRPGQNVWRLTTDHIAPGLGVELLIDYAVNGQRQSERHLVRRFPYFFRVDLNGVSETIRDNYDLKFNDGSLQMSRIRVRLVPWKGMGPGTKPLLTEAEAASAYHRSYPHPADMTRRHLADCPERDVRETSGFFPQSDRTIDDAEALQAAIQRMRAARREEKWIATEELGNYPQAIDILIEDLPGADIDQTLFIVKALAQIGDRRAIGPLLEKWKRAPRGAPGTRYIPDALAAIGDPSVVPELIAPLKNCRFDYRFHIAHALGALGGTAAETTLADLAANDPFPAVREEAQRALAALRSRAP
jgi:hypothetical protein